MKNKKRNKIILETVCEFLEKMNVKIEDAFVEDIVDELELKEKKKSETEKEEQVLVAVKVENPALLIGFKGRHLMPLQLLMSLAVKKRIGRWVRIFLDVNDYRGEQKERLVTKTREAAKKVKETGREESLGSMSSFERRICHMAVREIEGVTSESEGEGVYRHVVIKPVAEKV